MLCKEIANLFRLYCDVEEAAFLSDTDAARFLSLGYDDFRTKIGTRGDSFLAINRSVNYVSGGFIDLNGICLGTGVLTAPRLQRLVRVTYTPSGNVYPTPLRMCGTYEQFMTALNSFGTAACFLETSTGRLWVQVGSVSPLTITYIPYQDINWLTAIQPISTVEPSDNLGPFHELVALFAAKRYFIRDGAINPAIAAQTEALCRTLDQHLNAGQNNQRSIRVQQRDPWRLG